MKDVSSSNDSNFYHLPVMGNEIVRALKKLPNNLLKNGLIIDATLGGGGHSALILEGFPQIKIIGIDQDSTALQAALMRLKQFEKRTNIHSTNFADFQPKEKVIGVLADLGVSSPQLDNPDRGFSFRSDGPIDMRMNQNEGISAQELIHHLDENQLANTIYNFGEERLSRRIAKKIKNDIKKFGNYSGTKALAYAIAGCFPAKARYGRIHPATRTFQALRIAVNDELKSLDSLLKKAPEWLVADGLFMIISFHSLEDRNVKKAFKNDNRLITITKKPITATDDEISNNPRSRSAKLRIAQRIQLTAVDKN